jgi:hypothetical protein
MNVGRVIVILRRGLAAAVTVLTVGGCVPGAAASGAADPSPAAPTLPPPTGVPSTPVPMPTPSEIPASPSPTPSAPGADLPLATVSYRLPLTIRHVTADGVTLFFELSAPAAGDVFLRPVEAGGPVIERPLASDQARHRLTIDGLIPGTRYEVVVALGDAASGYQQPGFLDRAWGPVSFQTPSEGGGLRFGVIGDASFGDPATIALIDEMAGADLDFVLHTGDVVDETAQGVDPFDSYTHKFYAPFEPLLKQMPVYTAIGNHDYDADIRWRDAPFYYHAFPAFPDPHFPDQADRARNQYYAFAHAGIQFVVLDSQVFFGAPGYAEQDAWLRERLADPAYEATIPIFHVSPFSSSSVHPTNSLPVREVWAPLFEASNVPIVFSSHFHQYERLSHGGVTYIVTGGGSSILYAPGDILPESVVFLRQTHYVLVEIDPDRVTLSAIALGGDVLDRVEYPRQ